MSRVFHRDLREHYRVAVRGEGAYLIDREGRRYLDASGGAAVSCLGHSDSAVIDAIERQLRALPFAHTSFFTSEPVEALADALLSQAPAPLEKAYFVSGGSEAVEAALKLARQYFVELGMPQRRRVIARRQSYHGSTLGALAVGGNAARRKYFGPLLFDASLVAPCYPYRGLARGETEEQYGARLASELEAEILRLGVDQVMAFIAETVSGATLGAVAPVPGYLRRVREVCDRYGVLLVLDEVMCGVGRCGTLWAFEGEGVVPDMVAIAKGLGAGYQPIGALLVARRICEAIERGSGSFRHGHTYSGHAAACAGALAVQKRLQQDGVLARVAPMGRLLEAGLRAQLDEHPHVGEIRGRGLLWAVELVAERSSKRTLDPAAMAHARLKHHALECGLMCYPMGGTADGVRGDHVLLAPPYIVEAPQIEELVGKLNHALNATLRELPAAAFRA